MMTNTDNSPDVVLDERGSSRFPRWAKWVAALVAILLLVWMAMSFMGGPSGGDYDTVAARNGDMVVRVTATGNLRPTNEVTVGSETSGLVLEVFVEENDRVVRGQPLVQIDPERLNDTIQRSKASLDSARASVVQAQATANQSKTQLGRLEELFEISDGTVPAATELDTARADYQRAVASVAVAKSNVASASAQLATDRTNLKKSTIRSPVTGVILSRQVDLGQTVAASFNTPTLFLIAEDLSEMELEVKVDEADVGQVLAGQTAEFTVDAYPGQTFPAIIKRVNVGSSASSADGAGSSGVISYSALLQVDNADLILRPGMTATATIITSREEAVLLIPNGALRFVPPSPDAGGGPGFSLPGPPGGGDSTQEVTISRGAKQTIYVMGEDKQLTEHSVTIGSSNGNETIVTSETLEAGMQVVTGKLAAMP